MIKAQLCFHYSWTPKNVQCDGHVTIDVFIDDGQNPCFIPSQFPLRTKPYTTKTTAHIPWTVYSPPSPEIKLGRSQTHPAVTEHDTSSLHWIYHPNWHQRLTTIDASAQTTCIPEQKSTKPSPSIIIDPQLESRASWWCDPKLSEQTNKQTNKP